VTDGLNRMTGAELRNFVEHQMQMSANYQPVIIKNLIRADDGRLPADALARALMLEDRSQVAQSRNDAVANAPAGTSPSRRRTLRQIHRRV
jgi:hypothetical protein